MALLAWGKGSVTCLLGGFGDGGRDGGREDDAAVPFGGAPGATAAAAAGVACAAGGKTAVSGFGAADAGAGVGAAGVAAAADVVAGGVSPEVVSV